MSYRAVTQFRWETDRPTLFGLVTVVNEGAMLRLLTTADIVPGVPKALPFFTFVTDFLMRLPVVRLRLRGGRLV